MKDHQKLAGQRRRWINSSLFAFMYVFKNYYFNAQDSRHSWFDKYICLNLSMLIALISTFNSYITPSLFFFVLYSTIYQLGFKGSDIVAAVICLIYSLLFFSAVAGALTGKQWLKKSHIISHLLSIFTFGLFGLVIYNVLMIYLKVKDNFNALNSITMLVLVLLIINISCSIILLLSHLPTHCSQVLSIVQNFISYTYYTGAYSQTMVIHSFCNVDDVSWGTKGSGGAGVSRYLTGKVFFVSTW